MLSGFDGSRARLGDSFLNTLAVIGISLALVAVLTAALVALQRFVNVETVTIIYLIAVLYGAIRGGVVPALAAAVGAIVVSAFLFYPPIYDLRVHNPVHLIDLVLFILVAVVTGTLATDVRRARMREQADILREALIGSVSHELRTPLAAIIGSASVLAQSSEIAKHERLSPLVQSLREEAERLDDHIQNLLDSTRVSSQSIRPHAQWVDPGDIVNVAIERKQRLLTGHKLDVAVADDLPMLHTDPMLIEKALGQLIENAVKYSPRASPLEIKAERNDNSVRMSVRDFGSGLTEDERERIWERLYRGPRHRTDTAGSGLGLWIARALVEACGGRIEAFSAGAGRGATFSIHLPVREGAAAPIEDLDG